MLFLSSLKPNFRPLNWFNNQEYKPRQAELDRLFSGFSTDSLLKFAKDRPDSSVSLLSPLLTSFPSNINDYQKTVKTHCKSIKKVFSNLAKTVSEINNLLTSLSERLIDLKEGVNEMLFQERQLATAFKDANCDFSPLQSGFIESLNSWRWLKRTVD